jgi:hypothetical protein
MKFKLLFFLLIIFVNSGKIKKQLISSNFLQSLNFDEEISKLKTRINTILKDFTLSLSNNDFYTVDETNFSISDLVLTNFGSIKTTQDDYKYKVDENNIYIIKIDKPFSFNFNGVFKKTYFGLINFQGDLTGTINVDKITIKEMFKQEGDKIVKTDIVDVYLDKKFLEYKLSGFITGVIAIPERILKVFHDSLYQVIEMKLNKSINSSLNKEKSNFKVN